MTTEQADLLTLLSDPLLAEKAEQESNRPFNRFPGRHFKADIPNQELSIISRRVGNSQFDEWGMFLDLEVTEVYEGNVQPGEHTLWIRSANPYKRDGTPNKNTKNSELVQMTNAAGMNPREWLGKKGVVFEDAIHKYTQRKDTREPDLDAMGVQKRNADGSPRTIWIDEPASLFYYKLTFSQAGNALVNSAVANGATVQPKPESIAAAFLLLGDGMEESAFGLAVSKDPVIKKDNAMIGYVASGKFASDMIAEGKLVRDGTTLVAV
jgi:hypothetical protein